MEKETDVIIIGGGVAGCSAALYSARRAMKTKVIAANIGGQLALAPMVENYPALDSQSGAEIVLKIKKQAEKFGAEFVYGNVSKIKTENKKFQVFVDNKKYEARTVILAMGKIPRKLEAEGEKEFLGKGVSYCAICDGPLFRDKTVAVVGGGNSAFEAANFLANIAKHVTLIHRRSEFRAEPEEIKRLMSKKNITMIKDTKVIEIKGDNLVTGLVIEDINTKKTKEIKADGLFIEVGYEVKADFVGGLVDFNEKGEVEINLKGKTKTSGLFAAGDLTPTPYKQAVISSSSGVIAALSAWDYIECKQSTNPGWECPVK